MIKLRQISLIKLCLVSFIFVLSGCGDSSTPPLDYVPHMFDSEAVKAQHKGPDGISGRQPVEGTIAVDQEIYHYANDPEGSSQNKNPLPRTKTVLLRGQKMFNTFCIVCHGIRGEGDGYIIPKFPRPPSLQSDKVRNWADGRIFHVVTMGQNIMPSYASQIAENDRWAIIHYMRALQRSEHPTDEDLKEFHKRTQ